MNTGNSVTNRKFDANLRSKYYQQSKGKFFFQEFI